jgi:hypothetical protein
MAAPVRTVAQWQWPADVLVLAGEQKARACLDPLLQATQRIFPDARWLTVYLQADAEIPDERSIVFDVKLPGISPADARKARRQWNDELFRICPAPRAVPFVLLLDLGE